MYNKMQATPGPPITTGSLHGVRSLAPIRPSDYSSGWTFLSFFLSFFLSYSVWHIILRFDVKM